MLEGSADGDGGPDPSSRVGCILDDRTEAVVELVVLAYFIGMLVAGTAIRARAGTGVWRRLRILGPNGFGPVWFATAVLCSMAWPITLVVWLARGCPEPRVVFNHKAEERQRRTAARAATGI